MSQKFLTEFYFQSGVQVHRFVDFCFLPIVIEDRSIKIPLNSEKYRRILPVVKTLGLAIRTTEILARSRSCNGTRYFKLAQININRRRSQFEKNFYALLLLHRPRYEKISMNCNCLHFTETGSLKILTPP